MDRASRSQQAQSIDERLHTKLIFEQQMERGDVFTIINPALNMSARFYGKRSRIIAGATYMIWLQ